MSLKDSVATLTSHFEYLTLNFPAISFIHPLQASGLPMTFKATYSQPHMREELSHQSSYLFTFNPQASPSITPFPSFPTSENDVQIEVYSPSKDFRALFRKVGDKVILEIWGRYGLLKSFRVSDIHGAVYNDNQICLQGIVWSQDEKKIAYIAEKKEEKFPKYFDDFANDEEASKALKTVEYRQDLGESYNGKVSPTVFVCNISEEVIYRVANIPSEITPAQISFADSQGNSLVFCGFKLTDVRLGLKFCYNRDSKVYFIRKCILERTKEDKTKKLSDDEKKAQKEKLKQESEENKPILLSNDDIAIFPVLNKDLTKLVYCFSPARNTHTMGLGLKIVDMPQNEEQVTPKVVLDIVQEKSDLFAGIMGYHDKLSKTSFLGPKYVILNSDFKASVALFVVNVETREVRRIDKPKYQSEEWRLTAVENGLVFARISNVEAQNKIAIYEGFNPAADSIDDAIKNSKWHFCEVNPLLNDCNKKSPYAFLSQIGEIEERIIHHKDMESFYFSVKDAKDASGNLIPNNKKPLLVILHGGPHGTLTGLFSAVKLYAFYKGYNILCPNFYGSTGFGQKYLDDLVTKIGEVDVEQITSTIQYCIDNGLAETNNIAVTGGSYGGYLPFVLMAKFPELFKCAVIRNPVVSLGYSYEASDIPEWAACEVFNKAMNYEFGGEEMKKMFEMSPIGMNKNIKTSVLLMLGAKDRRVPPEAGIQYYKILKQNGVDITLLVYPEDEHSLAGNKESETDQFIRMFAYLDEKMRK